MNGTRLELGVNAGIEHCRTMLEECRDHAGTGADVEINAADVARADTATLQMLIALRRDLRTNGGTLKWLAVSCEMHDVAERMGLIEALGMPAVATPAVTNSPAEN
ncbi:MAG: STAS domain-containing protein [Gammaproteobacteria bacterium]|nr:STAS domain-containing protein [Gammaproteobacteria bacterium]